MTPSNAMTAEPARRFYFRSKGGRQRYRYFATEIVELLPRSSPIREADRKATVTIILKIQKGRLPENDNIPEYRATLAPEAFERFWHEIQALDIATLTSSSPNIEREQLDSSRPRRRVLDAPTHTYMFYDKTSNINNHFEVYNAAFLQDDRYQSLQNATFHLLRLTFGNEPF